MSVFADCQDARNMTSILEVECPECKESIEIFARDGRIVGDGVCENCGYTIPDGAYSGEYRTL